MKCPHCNKETIHSPCHNCGKSFEILNAEIIHSSSSSGNNSNKSSNDEVLEPEIVSDTYENERQNNQGQNPFSNNTYYNSSQNPQGHVFFKHYNLNTVNNNSCLRSLVSFFLSAYIFFELGFFAMLGFLFFLVVGKSLSFIVALKNLLRGYYIPPILLDIVVWGVSYWLVLWISE